ncbi:ribosomal protein S18-alanine N-acetyltransferase [Candidatus Thioglobus sp. NP1]|uniref:ribosomal protein S18-alanine N-acetyltransferase n=1 Tax=Candidatus Thioglobus sp. NP1 TaxID=2508687 RepID=UPI000DEDD04C|nr:ribosomal-protein-alanine N-acetyltransferase [Candidatus Thioglobus sp. NP1]
MKTKLTIKPISISFNKLNLSQLDNIVSIESSSSSYPWTKTQLKESIKNPNNLCYSATYEGDIIGYLIVMLASETADILNIGINPNNQRKGYGSLLMSYLYKELKNRLIEEVFLEVRESNQSAISFYLNQGFKEISIRKNYYKSNSNKLSSAENGIIMRLEI